jgi:hypothetical protein
MELPPHLADEIGEFVDSFVTPIALVKPNDVRDPPGDHAATGNFLLVSDQRYLLTCEHVARLCSQGKLGYTPFGAGGGQTIPSKFISEPYKVDVAAAPLSPQNWNLQKHAAQCVTPAMFSSKHTPVDDEFLYVYGFPGSEAKTGFGEHFVQGIGIFSHETDYNPILATESPMPIVGYHICLAYLPEYASVIQGGHSVLPLGPGLSGSLVWNTRYVEVTSRGMEWRPEHARITALVWGHSQKAGVLIATPIEYIRSTMEIT